MTAVEGTRELPPGGTGHRHVPRLMGVGTRWIGQAHTVLRVAMRYRYYSVVLDVLPDGTCGKPRVIRHRSED